MVLFCGRLSPRCVFVLRSEIEPASPYAKAIEDCGLLQGAELGAVATRTAIG